MGYCMKIKNITWREMATMDERIFGYCECCGNTVTDDNDEYYITDDGKVFCSIECVCEAYSVTKIEM